MQRHTQVKDISIRSASVVLIWNQILRVLPPLDPDICSNLFKDPKSTSNEITREGIRIVKSVKVEKYDNFYILPISPNLSFGYEKFSLANTSKNELLDSYRMIFQEISKNQQILPFLTPKVLGINIEFDISVDTLATEVLSERYNIKMDNASSDIVGTIIKEINLTLKQHGDHKHMNVRIQPSVLSDHSLYFHVNDHYGVTPFIAFPTPQSIEHLIEESITKFSSKILLELI